MVFGINLNFTMYGLYYSGKEQLKKGGKNAW